MWAVILMVPVLLGLWIYQLVSSGRWRSRLVQLEYDVDSLRDHLRQLTRRVFELEQAAGGVREKPVVREERVAPAKPVDAPVSVPPGPEPVVEPNDEQGWEAVLGGNWLNKIGVLVLVIGLALFIGYSFSLLGPGGRVAVSLAVSTSMLGGGAVLARNEKYAVFARGLMGGGWAALYSTTYAAHAIEEARVITDPALATLLLAAVAAGMILHSLRYRSEVVTGVAYVVAFVTLAIVDLTFFAVIALIPLAASLLWLAHRFRWTRMALLGLPATYGIYFLHAIRSTGGSLAAAQAILFLYWMVFEGFDLLESLRTRDAGDKTGVVFPLNAIAFTAVSVAQWVEISSSTLYLFFILAAAAYLASSVVRMLLLIPSNFAAEVSALDRARRGSYEGALTLAAAFTAVAIALKLSGLNISLAILVEAELLFLAGLHFRQAYVRHLGTVLLMGSVARMLAVDVPGAARMTLAGAQWRAWSPVAVLHAAVLYLNRSMLARGALFSHVAAGLLVLVLGFELPVEFVGLGWLLLSLALHELSLAKRLRDFAIQSYWVGGASLLMLVIKNGLDTGFQPDWRGWMPQLCGAVLLYGVATRFAGLGAKGWSATERESVRDIASTAGTVLLAAFLWSMLPASLTAVVWAMLGLVLLIAGIRLGCGALRAQSYILAVVTFVRTWAVNLDVEGSFAGIPVRVLTAVAVIASFYVAEILSARPRPGPVSGSFFQRIANYARPVFSWLATVLLAVLMHHEVSGSLLTVAWGVQGLILLFVGFPLRERCLRLSGLVLLLFCVLKLFLYDLRNLEMPFRVLSFLVLGVILIGVSFVYSRLRERISRYL